MPVVETVAVQAGGEKSLLRALDAMWPLPEPAESAVGHRRGQRGRDAARSAPHPRLAVSNPPSTDGT
jgi:ferrous iron transport protein B